jgi:hypothetical protein
MIYSQYTPRTKFERGDFRYELTKKGKGTCPQCGQKTLVPYIDKRTGQRTPDKYGKCDRANNCGYHLNPYTDGYGRKSVADNSFSDLRGYYVRTGFKNAVSEKVETSFIDKRFVNKSITYNDRNVLLRFLREVFPIDAVNKTAAAYRIGTNPDGDTVFWQVDSVGKVRTGKIMRYLDNGHRDKASGSVDWIHRALQLDNFNLVQCLFGEHLLKESKMVVGIVESEKTALIMSITNPNVTWLATGGLSNWGAVERAAKLLTGKKIILYPDLGGFDAWETKAKKLRENHFFDVTISRIIEEKATDADRVKGLDIADFVLRQYVESERAKTPADGTNTRKVQMLGNLSAVIPSNGKSRLNGLKSTSGAIDNNGDNLLLRKTASETASETASAVMVFSIPYPFLLYKEAANSTDLLPDYAKGYDWDAELCK